MSISLVLLILLYLNTPTKTLEEDYYELLGISKEANDLEIRQAFKKLAIVYHPDKNPNAPREHFIKISEAYEVLKNPQKRREYNYMKQGRTRKFQPYGMTRAEYNDMFYNGLYSKDENVESLSGDNFYEFVDGGYAFVNFYSPFCPPCQNLASTWKKLANQLRGIIKIGALNCKLFDVFCTRSMGIRSYPTLLLYKENGSRFLIYRGQLSFESLEKFIMNFIGEKITIPVVDRELKNNGKPVLYVIGDQLLDEYTVTRIAFKLKRSMNIVRVMAEKLRDLLTNGDHSATAVFKMGDKKLNINQYNDEKIIDAILKDFISVKEITPEDIPTIRSTLRNENQAKPWVLHFYKKSYDTKLLVNRLAMTNSDYEFGTINCEDFFKLCLSFQVDSPPAWGILKTGGAYEMSRIKSELKQVEAFLKQSKDTYNYQTLSASEFRRIVDGDEDVLWALIVIPHSSEWQTVEAQFKKASTHFNSEQMQFGVVHCKKGFQCESFTDREPLILVQNRTKRFVYRNQHEASHIVEFIKNIFINEVIYLNEKTYNEILNPKPKGEVWFVFFAASHCGPTCDLFQAELRIVSNKLKTFGFIKIAVIDCRENKDYCVKLNIVKATIRLYPRNNNYGYVGNVEELNKAPYISSWILDRFDDVIIPLKDNSFKELITNNKSKKPWLVYFHSPRCSHCYEHYPDFVRSGLKLGDKIRLGRVNCLTERNLCHQNQINRYPTMLLFANFKSPSQSFYIDSLQSEKTLLEVERRLEALNYQQIHTEL